MRFLKYILFSTVVAVSALAQAQSIIPDMSMSFLVKDTEDLGLFQTRETSVTGAILWPTAQVTLRVEICSSLNEACDPRRKNASSQVGQVKLVKPTAEQIQNWNLESTAVVIELTPQQDLLILLDAQDLKKGALYFNPLLNKPPMKAFVDRI